MKFSGQLTLHNDFHNTTATVVVKEGIISPSSLKRARKKLCGIKGCNCGEIRSPQDKIVNICSDYHGEYAEVYDKVELEPKNF